MLCPLDWLHALHIEAFLEDTICGMENEMQEMTRTDAMDLLMSLPTMALKAVPRAMLTRMMNRYLLAEVGERLGAAYGLWNALADIDDSIRWVTDGVLRSAECPDLLDWVGAREEDLSNAVKFVRPAVPPVLVAIHLAKRDKLDDAMYGTVVKGGACHMGLADYAALSCFSPLVREHDAELLGLARRSSPIVTVIAPGNNMYKAYSILVSPGAVKYATVSHPDFGSVTSKHDTVSVHRHRHTGGLAMCAYVLSPEMRLETADIPGGVTSVPLGESPPGTRATWLCNQHLTGNAVYNRRYVLLVTNIDPFGKRFRRS